MTERSRRPRGHMVVSHEFSGVARDLARDMRKTPTVAEALLWQSVRGKQLDGRRFRRQQPIGRFIVDFFCADERLIVEVDGGIHELQQDADKARAEILECLGYRVLRFSNDRVVGELSRVLEEIKGAFVAVEPRIPPSPTPSP